MDYSGISDALFNRNNKTCINAYYLINHNYNNYFPISCSVCIVGGRGVGATERQEAFYAAPTLALFIKQADEV